MLNEKRRLYLYEALELRSEYDARIKTLRDCLPESRKNRGRYSFSSENDRKTLPSAEFDVKRAVKQIAEWEKKKRKLNNAIQRANFSHQVQFQGENVNLNEALELRKSLNETMGDLHTRVVHSSYQRVIYKEDRDILEPNELSYREADKNLEESRLFFRQLNRKIRRASFTVVVDYFDE